MCAIFCPRAGFFFVSLSLCAGRRFLDAARRLSPSIHPFSPHKCTSLPRSTPPPHHARTHCQKMPHNHHHQTFRLSPNQQEEEAARHTVCPPPLSLSLILSLSPFHRPPKQNEHLSPPPLQPHNLPLSCVCVSPNLRRCRKSSLRVCVCRVIEVGTLVASIARCESRGTRRRARVQRGDRRTSPLVSQPLSLITNHTYYSFLESPVESALSREENAPSIDLLRAQILARSPFFFVLLPRSSRAAITQ